MGYLHLDLVVSQTSRHAGAPCGDVVTMHRSKDFTWAVLADGLGHGIRAHVEATLYSSQLTSLLAQNFSLREAFSNVVRIIHNTRGQDAPYAALQAARVRSDGETTVLVYDAPPPLFVGRRVATILPGRSLPVGAALISESTCFLEPGEGLLLMSDGVTQAGLGRGRFPLGLTSEGVARFVEDCLTEGIAVKDVPKHLLTRARDLWGEVQGDDVTALMLHAREGQVLTVLTGPCANRKEDHALVARFLASRGLKAIAGASTAQMVARQTGEKLRVEQNGASSIAPPRYYLNGVDLVTEGAVTLNQVLNILGEDPTCYEPDSGVSAMAEAFRQADRIDFLIGRAPNLGGRDIAFLQQGIQPRTVIVPLLQRQLEAQGKLVTCEWF